MIGDFRSQWMEHEAGLVLVLFGEGAAMLELLVLRHAKSSWADPTLADYDRPLKKRGKRDAKNMGAYILAQGLVPDLVIASTAKRAVQTVKRSLKSMGLSDDKVRWSGDLYHGEPNTWIDMLSRWGDTAQRVMIVGHNPGLEELVTLLCSSPIPEPEDGKLLPTAALAHLRLERNWGQLQPGSAQMLNITRPRSLVETV